MDYLQELAEMRKEEAKKYLTEFNDQASIIEKKQKFEISANVVYGNRKKYFEIKEDNNLRMFFKCTICNKDLNNVRSLNDHASCGSHRKNVSNYIESVPHVMNNLNEPKMVYADKSSLQYRLSISKLPILGLDRVEEYNQCRKKKSYFICTLCHFHGKTEEMFNHLLGDIHTDKYIRNCVVLKSEIITSQERDYLRKFIFDYDKTTEKDIKVIISNDPQLYPFELEYENLPVLLGQGERPDKRKRHRDMETFFSIKQEPVEKSFNDSNVQTEVSTGSNLEHMLICMSHIIHNKHNLSNIDDLLISLKLMFAALHMLFFAVDIRLNENPLHYEANTRIQDNVRKCMGTIKKELSPHLLDKYQLDAKLTHQQR